MKRKRLKPLRNFPNRRDIAAAQKLAKKISLELYNAMEAKPTNQEKEVFVREMVATLKGERPVPHDGRITLKS